MNTTRFLELTFHEWEKPLLPFLPFSAISQDKSLVSKDTCCLPQSIQFKHCILVSFVQFCICLSGFFFFFTSFPYGAGNQAVRRWQVLKGHFWIRNCLCAGFSEWCVLCFCEGRWCKDDMWLLGRPIWKCSVLLHSVSLRLHMHLLNW